ncbi:FecR family protein [Flavivirga spongiicola]|uniref:FecR family protein n=1 Tax=Flavivirga spongiicola TaxID=421621 RepID=A0ABU7XVZ2_9FLAO|nr:FecR family protein [Flavivirga sp. MEBiC05379]MDO5979580.1 FecR family protein [Flavivirga sp. MEBiC05379]
MENEKIEKHLKRAELITKALYKNLSKQEKTAFESWLNESQKNKDLFQKFQNQKLLEQKISDYSKIDVVAAKASVLQKHKARTRKINLIKWYKYAAIFIGIIGLTTFIHLQQSNLLNTKNTDNQLTIKNESITLQLDNGDIQEIDINKAQKITDTQGVILGMQQGSKLVYNNKTINHGDLTYNTLKIPHGKMFQIVLSDGTKVHLNAGSSLRYPTQFLKGMNRQVFVTGEAFLDVAKNLDHPFIVNAQDVNIKVLGTQFNVSSYPEDQNINTVLVEGSVKIFNNDIHENAILLKPNQMASWNKTLKQTSINEVDTNIYTEWMNGKFNFYDTPFKNILKKLERHYNVHFKNHYKDIENRQFTSSFNIKDNIEKVLDVFSEYMEFEYMIQNNTIIIINP